MTQPKIKPLIFIPSPREIAEFKQAASALKYDKLWVKNFREIVAYYHARNYFLDHEEYTHLVILPDDLILKPEGLDQLLEDAKRYLVISGWCVNTIRQMWNYNGPPEKEPDSNVSYIPPPDPPISGSYEQYQFLSVNHIRTLLQSGKNIIRVNYAGFPPTVIDRQICEEIPFRSEVCCVDSCFSLDLFDYNIDQYCDLRVETEHLELRQKAPAALLVGKEPAKVILERPSGDRTELYNVSRPAGQFRISP